MLNGWQLKSLLAGATALFVAAIGGWDVLAQSLVALIALDVAGGLVHAFYDNRLNSSVMLRGLLRKTAYFAAVVMAVWLDRAIFHAAPAARTLVISYLCVNESLSILEHLAAVGVPLPVRLRDALVKLRHGMDNNNQGLPTERPKSERHS